MFQPSPSPQHPSVITGRAHTGIASCDDGASCPLRLFSNERFSIDNYQTEEQCDKKASGLTQ